MNKKHLIISILFTAMLALCLAFSAMAEGEKPCLEAGGSFSCSADAGEELTVELNGSGTLQITVKVDPDCSVSLRHNGNIAALENGGEAGSYTTHLKAGKGDTLTIVTDRNASVTVSAEKWAEPQEEPKPEPKSEPKSEPKPEPESQTEPEPELESQPGSESEPEEQEPIPEEPSDQAEQLNIEEAPAQENQEQEPETPQNPELPSDSENQPEPEHEQEQEDAAGKEIQIKKTLRIGETWEGTVRNTKPAILKLDLDKAQKVYVLVEGKGLWATMMKADHLEENPGKDLTDPDSNRTILSWDAENASYLITLGPVEGRMMSKARISIMDEEAFRAWEEEQAEEDTPENSDQITDEPEPIDENIPESNPEPERSITVNITWDVPNPVIGDTAHFKADLNGYDGLTYTMQWQYGPDRKTWYDIPGETEASMDVVVTPENNLYYWRILVYVEEEQEP